MGIHESFCDQPAPAEQQRVNEALDPDQAYADAILHEVAPYIRVLCWAVILGCVALIVSGKL